LFEAFQLLCQLINCITADLIKVILNYYKSINYKLKYFLKIAILKKYHKKTQETDQAISWV
jgi:acid phosphatase family membrane protein YuiD